MGDRQRTVGDAAGSVMRSVRGHNRALRSALLCICVACGDAEQRAAPSPDSAAVPAAGSASGAGSGATDDGGAAVVPDMLGRIRTGLGSVVPEAERDRTEALRRVQELYSTGLEPLLYTYGEGGSAFAGNALAAAIARLDLDLQELMRLLEAADTDIGIIRNTVAQAERTVYEVESEAIAAGVGG